MRGSAVSDQSVSESLRSESKVTVTTLLACCSSLTASFSLLFVISRCVLLMSGMDEFLQLLFVQVYVSCALATAMGRALKVVQRTQLQCGWQLASQGIPEINDPTYGRSIRGL